MNRKDILDRLIDLVHINFNPSNEHLYKYAQMTDKELKETLEFQQILTRLKH